MMTKLTQEQIETIKRLVTKDGKGIRECAKALNLKSADVRECVKKIRGDTSYDCRTPPPPLVEKNPGVRLCLKCESKFMSVDLKTNRICKKCARDGDKYNPVTTLHLPIV